MEGTPKTVTLSREADGWYVTFSCEGVPIQPLPPTGRETGIDVGLKVFLITAHGLVIETPRHFRKGERRIAKAGKAVVRCQKGTQGRKKVVVRRAKAHQKVKRQRLDFHHKVALQLVRDNDVIYLEDVQIANLSRRAEARRERGLSPEWGQAQSGPQPVDPRRRVGAVPYDPHFQGSMGREASGTRAPSVHQPGL